MNEIYLAKNHLMIKTEYSDPEIHRHSAAHIVLSLNGPVCFKIGARELTGQGALIPSDIPHTVCGGTASLLLFMFDETTSVAQNIWKSRLIEESKVHDMIAWYQNMQQSSDPAATYPTFLHKVLQDFSMPDTLQATKDMRIRDAYTYIDGHIGSDLTVAAVAAHIGLSESRFSHLFRQEAGMSAANYCVFRKLYFTYLGLMKGKNITTAALDAGFSDSSHFAATNKRMFGISPTAISASMKIFIIAEI